MIRNIQLGTKNKGKNKKNLKGASKSRTKTTVGFQLSWLKNQISNLTPFISQPFVNVTGAHTLFPSLTNLCFFLPVTFALRQGLCNLLLVIDPCYVCSHLWFIPGVGWLSPAPGCWFCPVLCSALSVWMEQCASTASLLASVREQERQFEMLSRALEEERRSCAGTLPRPLPNMQVKPNRTPPNSTPPLRSSRPTTSVHAFHWTSVLDSSLTPKVTLTSIPCVLNDFIIANLPLTSWCFSFFCCCCKNRRGVAFLLPAFDSADFCILHLYPLELSYHQTLHFQNQRFKPAVVFPSWIFFFFFTSESLHEYLMSFSTPGAIKSSFSHDSLANFRRQLQHVFIRQNNPNITAFFVCRHCNTSEGKRWRPAKG